jgi:hypothetical protein
VDCGFSVEYVYSDFDYFCAGVCCDWWANTLFSDSRGFDCNVCVGYWRVFCEHFAVCFGWWAAVDWVGVDSDGYC